MDLWINSKKEYIVVDYNATAKAEDITALDKDWQIGYKRQMEVYQWLLRRLHTLARIPGLSQQSLKPIKMLEQRQNP